MDKEERVGEVYEGTIATCHSVSTQRFLIGDNISMQTRIDEIGSAS